MRQLVVPVIVLGGLWTTSCGRTSMFLFLGQELSALIGDRGSLVTNN